MGCFTWLIEELFHSFVGAFLFMTGQFLLKIVTLGKHRIRWWDVHDPNVTWFPSLLGLAFWLGAGALVYHGFAD